MSSSDIAPPEPTRLVLIRHGESRSTVDRVVGGHRGCSGLTDRGVRQAKALRDRLTETGELAAATAVLTSVLPRAIETADIIAPAFSGLE
ncbi:MAG TPA: phosphoglycerate mutase family protein, partial [Acidimicrobiia bacterium]|nr:phosphoglycerate mutase family protein [Acidimicrobiia bacterium]